jgi:hypothetical protein
MAPKWAGITKYKLVKTDRAQRQMFRAQADWVMILTSATTCKSNGSLVEKNAAVQPVQAAHTIYFFH